VYHRRTPGRGSPPDKKFAGKARRWWLLAAPSTLFFVLTLPLFSFPFLFDDFNFLDRATHFRFSQLLPDPQLAFYRPISRELYFGFVAALGRSNPLLGHLVNLVIGIACVVLVGSLARKLAGSLAGLFAGLFFASLGALPFLVGWVSGSQDLLAMLFFLIAIHLQMAGRVGPALICAGAALLSKETALFSLPAVALLPGILDRDWSSARRNVIYYGCLIIGWAVLNRPVGSLAKGGLVTGVGGYIGLDNSQAAPNIARELAAVVNVSVNAKTWPTGLGVATAVALLVLAVVFISLRSDRTGASSRNREGSSRILLVGAAIGVIPAILTAVIAKHWWPYYACFPAIGTSILLSVGALKTGERYALPLVGMFLLLGVWARGTETAGRSTAAEQSFRRVGSYLQRIAAQLHQLHPSFPDSSRLYMTVNMSEGMSIQYHLFSLQAPRVWYWNRTLLTDDPGRLHPGNGREYLFSVTPECQIYEIELPGLTINSLGARPDYREYQSAVRSFAYGLAAQGRGSTDRAVDILLRMKEPDSLAWAFDRRLAATFLFASDREHDARVLCGNLPELSRRNALDAVAAVLGPELPGLRLDNAAFRAYGIPQDDDESYRFLMGQFSAREQLPQTRRMADRLLVLIPGDGEASAMIEALDEYSQRMKDNSVPWLRH
jgi:hypothetical protein